MSQKKKCEFAQKRGAKIITHIVFIKPDLSRDRAFLVSPNWDRSMRRTSRKATLKKMVIPVNGDDPNGKLTLFVTPRCMENPKVHPLTSCYKLSKESRFLNKKWRFGGGITPPDKPLAEYAPHFLRGFFYRSSQPVNPQPPPLPPPMRWNH